MKVVSHLLLNNLIIVCAIILLIEIIISLIYYGLFVNQINKATPTIQSQSFIHIEEILNSFNQIINRRYANALTDLYLIQKHLECFTDGMIDAASPYSINIQSEALTALILEEDNQFPKDYLMTLKNNTVDKDPEEQIRQLLSEGFLNTMVFYNGDANNPIDFTNMTFRGFYYRLIEIMKAIAIRDILTSSHDQQHVLLNKDIISAYPPMPLAFDDIKKLDYYSIDDNSCRESNYEQRCFRKLLTSKADPIKILYPIYKAGGMNSHLCINIDDTLTLCSDFLIKSSLGDDFINESNKIYIVSYNQSSDDIQVFYNMDTEIYNDNAFFQSDLSNKFKYNNDRIYSLFHILYYKILGHSTLTSDLIEYLEEEYIEGTADLKQFLKSNTSPSITKRFISYFTFFNQQYDSYGRLTQKNGYSVKDTFLMAVSPIVPQLLKWDNQNNRIKASPDTILFYSIVICNNKERAFYKEHSSLFMYKELKLGAYYLCLIIFGIFCLFNLMYDFTNYVLDPIKIYYKGLKNVFSQSMAYMEYNLADDNDNDNDNKREDKEERIEDNWSKDKGSFNSNHTNMTGKCKLKLFANNNLNKRHNDSNSIETQDKKSSNKAKNSNKEKKKRKAKKSLVFTNRDTKELETNILFIKNIYYNKSTNSIENLQNKISIFEHLSNVILNQDASIIKIDCLYLISYVQYKMKSYDNSLNTLAQLIDIIKKLKHNESSNESLLNYYIKITQAVNRNDDTKYFNDYSKEFSSTEIDKGVMLNIKAQQIYFFNSLIALTNHIVAIKPQMLLKANAVELNNSNSNECFDLCIKYMGKFQKINSLLKTNQLRVVFSYYLLSKCYSEMNNENEALNNIRSALFELFDFNKHFNKPHAIEPSIMLFSNSILIQVILLQLSEILIAIKKHHLAGIVLQMILEISPYATDSIHHRAVCNLNRLLNDQIPLLTKIENRLSIAPPPKSICFLSSTTLTSKWISVNELRMFCIKMIKKHFASTDRLLYWNYSSMPYFIHNPLKYFMTKEAISTSNLWMYFFKKNRSLAPLSFQWESSGKGKAEDDDDIKLIETASCPSAINYALNEFIKTNETQIDRYIFNFIMGEDINTYNSINKELIKALNKEKVSLFTLCFNYQKVDQKVKDELVSIHRKLHEGIVFWINDIELIKLPFENIARGNGTKNMFKISSGISNNIC